MSFAIPKPGRALPRDRKAHAAAKRLAALHNKGILIDSQTVTVEQLDDGRYRIHLAQDIINQLKTLGVKIVSI